MVQRAVHGTGCAAFADGFGQRIRTAVLELAGDERYDGASMEDLAADAGARPSELYERWPSKPELLVTAVGSLLDEIPVPDGGDVRDDLVGFTAGWLHASRGDLFPLHRGVATRIHSSPDIALAYGIVCRQMNRALGGIVSRAVRRSQLPARAGDRADRSDRSGLAGEALRVLWWYRLRLANEPLTEADAGFVVDDVVLPILRDTGERPGPGTFGGRGLRDTEPFAALAARDLAAFEDGFGRRVRSAALDLFGGGDDEVTVEELARHLGVDAREIYERWPSKPDLMVHLAYSYLAEVPVPDTGRVDRDLREYAGQVVPGSDLRILFHVVLSELHRSRDAVASYGAVDTYLRSTIGGIVRRGVERGELPPAAPVDLGVQILRGRWIHRYATGGDFDEAFVAESVDGMVMPVLLHGTDGRHESRDRRDLRAAGGAVPIPRVDG